MVPEACAPVDVLWSGIVEVGAWARHGCAYGSAAETLHEQPSNTGFLDDKQKTLAVFNLKNLQKH